MNKEMAEFIAAWWADFLRTGRRNEAHLRAIGKDSNFGGVLTDLLGRVRESAAKSEFYLDKVNTFERELTRLLLEGPDEATHQYGLFAFPHRFILAVDYNPQGMLARAMSLAKLPVGPASGLPYKTQMLIVDSNITVSMGPGVERNVTIYKNGAPVPQEDTTIKVLPPSDALPTVFSMESQEGDCYAEVH